MEIPERWLAYLHILDQYLYKAVIAGGCLRDLDYDLEPKDVDIFVHRDPETQEDDHQLIDDASNFANFGLKFITSSSLEYANPRISYALNMKDNAPGAFNPLPVQLVYTKAYPPSMEVPFFDFGICQIWCGMDGEVHTTEAYEKDKLDKTLTITRCDNKVQARRTAQRIHKFFKKFPDHRLIIPEQYKQLLGEAKDYSN